jgi:Domain of unknown function (DUF4262)
VRDCHCLLCFGVDEGALVAGVARRGWHVVVREGHDGGADYAFTVGLWHSFGSAEAALFGLDLDDITGWLDAVGAQARAGRIVSPDRQEDDILGSFPVFPRPVLASWHRHYFAEALEFYRGQPVPVVQLVWADVNGTPPWEPDCDEYCRAHQPRLWDRNPSHRSPAGWPFPVSPDALVLTTKAIAFGGGAVVGVVHDEEGEWQFLDDPCVDMADLTIVHLAHVTLTSPELTSLGDLPPGWEAWRDASGRWSRQPLEAD